VHFFGYPTHVCGEILISAILLAKKTASRRFENIACMRMRTEPNR